MTAEELPEIEDEQPGAAPPSAAPIAPPAYAYGPQPADPRLYRFFWCAMACVLGTLMPFTSQHAEWKADAFNRALSGPVGFETFCGALVGFFSLLVAAQYWWCMKYRKVKVWPLLIMLPIVIVAWFTVVQGVKARLGFDWKGKDPLHPAVTVPGAAWGDVRFWNSLFSHVGAGWLLVLLGSTAFFIYFILAVAGVGGAKKAAPAGRARR